MAVALAIMATPASADRFGPPLMDRIIAGETILYAGADRSQPIGPLSHDAVVVVLGQDGDMVQVPEGWVSAADVAETTDPWANAASPDADHPYNLPNVPFAQYYKDGGYALHGTYWHDLFGTDESQGCINLTWTDAAYLFAQTTPQLQPDMAQSIASGGQEATVVEILGN